MSPLTLLSLSTRKKWAVVPALAALSTSAQAQDPHPAQVRPPRAGRVFHVPSESPTIQGAIERARDGDVVVVAPGTYRERIDFLGKAIEVVGTEGPKRTILRAPHYMSPVVLFRNGEGADSHLMGFTITGGTGDTDGFGGGVSCGDYNGLASPYLSDCIIDSNFTDFLETAARGAGIHGNAILERCVLRRNGAFDFAGGAAEGVLTLLQCVIEDNWSCEGGGLRLYPGSLVRECVIQRNGTGPCSYHGILYTSVGGGVLAPEGPVELIRCVLRDNWVDEYPDPVNPTACPGQNSGAALHAGSGVTLRGCTIVGNHPLQCAWIGGVGGSPELVDSILRANEDPPGHYADRDFRFCNVQGGAAGLGSFDAEPLLGIDLRPGPLSPGVDRGDPASPADPDGTRADVGAFYFPRGTSLAGVLWEESAELVPALPEVERFGRALAASGDTLLVGATPDTLAGAPGSAHVFRHQGSGWVDIQRLVPSSSRADNEFGRAVALDGHVAVVSSAGLALANLGAVTVFERVAPDAPFFESAVLLPDVPDSRDHFGSSVALDGEFLVIGADHHAFDEPGRAFVYRRIARGRWERVAALHPADEDDPDVQAGFGACVAIDGSTLVVGAPKGGGDRYGYRPGAALVYERAGRSPHSWVFVAELAPLDPHATGAFGRSVSVSRDTIAVSHRTGAQTFERRGPGLPWQPAASLPPAGFRDSNASHTGPTVLVREDRLWLTQPPAGPPTGLGEVREFFRANAGAPWFEVARFAPERLTFDGALAFAGGTLFLGRCLDGESGKVEVFTRGPEIDALAVDQAADEEEVAIRGQELDRVTRVLVDGVEQPIVRRSASELVIRPARRDPGFADLALVSAQGTLALPDGFESLPSLRVSPGQPGGTTGVRLVNGASGGYLLLISLDLRPTPLTLVNPPTWYGLWLDLVPGRSGRLAVDAFDSSGVAERTFVAPSNAALAGLPIHLQAWCRRGVFGPGRYSFTNLVSHTL